MSAIATAYVVKAELMDQLVSLTKLTGWSRFVKGPADAQGILRLLNTAASCSNFEASGWLFNPFLAWIEESAPERISAARAHPVASALLRARAVLEAFVISPTNRPQWTDSLALAGEGPSPFLEYCEAYYRPADAALPHELIDIPAHAEVVAFLKRTLDGAEPAASAILLLG